MLCSYYALQVVLRTTLSSTADLDEAEQALLAQNWSWGYGAQPPLYTWLQIGFFRVFGISILAESLLKNFILLSTCLLTAWSGRLVTGSLTGGVAAAAALFCLPQFAWESQRDLTHSVLASAMSAAVLLCFLKLCLPGRGSLRNAGEGENEAVDLAECYLPKRQSSVVWHLLLGLSVAAALLAKHNTAFWILGLFAAALTLPQARRIMLNRRMVLSCLVCGIVLAPYLLWVWRHPASAMESSSKLAMQAFVPWYAATWRGLTAVISGIAAFLGPLFGVFALLSLKSRVKGWPDLTRNVGTNLLCRTFLATFALLLVFVLLFHVTSFKSRWLQPLLISAPILTVAILSPRLNRLRLNLLVGMAASVMVLVLILFPGRLLTSGQRHKDERLARPYPELTRQLTWVPQDALVVADTKLLAGNLRLGLPEVPVIVPGAEPTPLPARPHCFLVWDASRDMTRSVPQNLREWVKQRSRMDPTGATARYISAPYKFGNTLRLRLGIVQLY
ncbi:MAG TPA: hypothetical protein VN673_03490 [Clostridia bacterium]|nr:hypothetical protein [Clostridia bacterium]